ncbi:uncharacterized protein PV09_02056 [Verruconis gallopava]|uniref:Ubiquitin-like protease family profile domain-containing protein n=1 Tax=Verruconis gallopava TaxID=253628 RepID=A0A0D2AKX0_9PEZI|nr:uncharacterized protein PV09_02056 [Verruconis gallopava]KIW07190.1 hypothetical protein PV09_02056 [Verruconis gallopava]
MYRKIVDSVSEFLGKGNDEGDFLRSSSAPVDLTEDNDAGKSSAPNIRPPPLPSRPTTYNTKKLRERIDDPYPEPPSRILKTESASMTHQRKAEKKDELRLLGNFRAPDDAVRIEIPYAGTQTDTRPHSRPGPDNKLRTVPMSGRKPGSGGAFLPRDTISHTKHQGKAFQTNSFGGKGTGAHRNELAVEISRGENVRKDANDFTEDDRPTKRQRLNESEQRDDGKGSQMGGKTADVEVTRVSKASGHTAPQTRRIGSVVSSRLLSPWEVSGAQESRQLDRLLERPARQQPTIRNFDTVMIQASKPANYTSSSARKPDIGREVLEISDDESTNRQSVGTYERPSKRPFDGAEVATEAQCRTKINQATGLSEFYRMHDRVRNPKKPRILRNFEIEDEDVEPSTILKSQVLNVLGPKRSTAHGLDSKKQAQLLDHSSRGEARELIQSARRQSPTRSPSRKGPPKRWPSSPQQKSEDTDQEDELHGNGSMPGSFLPEKSSTRKPTAALKRLSGKQRPHEQKSFSVAKLVDANGVVWENFEFMQLQIDAGDSYHNAVLLDQNGKPVTPGCSLDLRNTRKVVYSTDPQSSIMRLELGGTDRVDIEFHDHDVQNQFLEAVKDLTTIKDELKNKTAAWMKGVFGKRDAPKQPSIEVIDDGVEQEVLAKRVERNTLAMGQAKHAAVEDSRPRSRRTLISQMKANEASNNQTTMASALEPAERRSTRLDASNDVILPSALRSTRTSMRTQKATSPSSEPHFERYSKTHGLGRPWEQPLVYPEVGKKRATVNFADLERLDEGELLNDNLLEFYIRWLQENRKDKLKPHTAYFFNTFFYTVLSDTSSLSRLQRAGSSINFSAVERWTAKDDIFSYDFVIVPVNEAMHWYLAIICNLPNLLPRVENAIEKDLHIGLEAQADDKKSSSQSVKLLDSPDARIPDESTSEVVEVDGTEAEEPRVDAIGAGNSSRSTPNEPANRSVGMKTGSPISQKENREAGRGSKTAEIVVESERTFDLDEVLSKSVRPSAPDSQGSSQVENSQINTSQMSDGLFGNATPSSGNRQKKGRRKSAPPLRRYNTAQPMIVIMDPMGTAHPRTVAALKEYLVAEAKQKRDMNIDRDNIKSMTARAGIPQQNNYYDCGIYVLGYLDKFMEDPQEFGRKLLSREFDLHVDWPEMQPTKMRAQMRGMLQELAKQQQEARAAKAAARRAAKARAKASISNTLAPLSAQKVSSLPAGQEKAATISAPTKQWSPESKPSEEVQSDRPLPL